MTYFTFLHIIAIIIILLIFFTILFFTSRESKRSVVLSMLFANVLITAFLGVISMIVLDKYTKVGVLESIEHNRILQNETIIFKGVVRNAGKFTITNCKLELKLVNATSSRDNLKDNIFKPSGFFTMSKKMENQPNSVVYKFKISPNLKPNEKRKFTLTMPYPSYFNRPTSFEKLHCY